MSVVFITLSCWFNKHWVRSIYRSHFYSIFVKNISVLALIISVVTTIFTYMVNQNVSKNNARSARNSRAVAQQTKNLMNLSAPVYYDLNITLTPLIPDTNKMQEHKISPLPTSSIGVVPTFKVKAGQISAIYVVNPKSFSNGSRNISFKSFHRLNRTPINPDDKKQFQAPNIINFKVADGTQYLSYLMYFLIVDNQQRLHVDTLEIITSPSFYAKYGSSTMLSSSQDLLAYKLITNDDLLSADYVTSNNNWVVAKSVKIVNDEVILTTKHDSIDTAAINTFKMSQGNIISDIKKIERQYKSVYSPE
jgi:hypothetical protein